MPVVDTMAPHPESIERWRLQCQSFRSRLLCLADEYEDMAAQYQQLLSKHSVLQPGQPVSTIFSTKDIDLLGTFAPPPPPSARATPLSGTWQSVSLPASPEQHVEACSEATMVTGIAKVPEQSFDNPFTGECQEQIIRMHRYADSSGAGPSRDTKQAAPQDNKNMQVEQGADDLSTGRLQRRCVLKRMNLCFDEADTDLGDLNVALAPHEEALLRETLSDLWVKFKSMASMSDGLVDERELQLFCFGRRHAKVDHAQYNLKLDDLIVALNEKGKFVKEARQSKERQHKLNFDAFVELMLMEDAIGILGSKMADDVCTVRRLFLKKTTTDFLARKTRTQQSVFSDHEDCLTSNLMDVVSAAMIVVNAVFIGVVADHPSPWIGLKVLEFAFVTFFAVELVYRVRLTGFVELFCGHSAVWHRFEAFLVAVSLLDTMLLLAGKHLDSGSEVQVLRILRLARLARVAQLMRLKSVKEAILMVNGFAQA